jgi:hypothetical protein
MRTRALLVCVVLAAGSFGVATPLGSVPDGQAPAKTAPAKTPAQAPAPAKPTAETLDQLLAPIALYPDALLSQVLLCATNPGKLGALSEWLQSQPTLKGSELQDAAKAAGFEASFLALVVFPDVVDYMAGQMEWTVRLGQAFTADQSAVFASVQRLRTKARDAGKLKSTPQQDVETRTTSSGQQVIVIEPSNPQVVYVPQYNPATVYTTSSTVVVEQSSSSADAVAAGVIGFTAGIAIGAAFDNDYYYGPYGMHGGFYMYDDAWDDWYDHREDAREDWMDHREDLYEERGDRREDLADQRTERAGNAQEQRSERAQTRQENRPEAQAQREQRRAEAQASGTRQAGAGTASQESRGYSREQSAASRERSGSGSSAFSGYSSGRSERAASQRGQRSRGSSGGRRR